MKTTHDIHQVSVEDTEIYYVKTLAFGLGKEELLQRIESLKAERANFQVFAEQGQESVSRLVYCHINLVKL